MIYELKIALRFLKSGKAQTTFIILGIALGVAVQIFLGSLITSLQGSLVDNTIGNSAHITIRNQEDATTRLLEEGNTYDRLLRGNYTSIVKYLDNWSLLVEQIEPVEGVKAVSPVLQGTGLVNSSGKSKSVVLKGVQLDKADPIYNLSNRMVEGNPLVEGNSVLIGRKLSENLSISSGNFINLILPNGESVRLLVSGVFDLENEAVNESLIFMDLKRAQKLFNTGNGISAIEIQLEDPFEAGLVAEEWRNTFDYVKIDEWQEQNQQLLSALSSQSSSSYTIQFFVILAVTLGISSVLAVSVVQKSKEIGILKAMGATSQSAGRIFILQGLILGLIGSVIGSLLGILLLAIFNSSGSLTFAIAYKWNSILLISGIAIAAGTLASVIPARRSANLNPMEAIKNG